MKECSEGVKSDVNAWQQKEWIEESEQNRTVRRDLGNRSTMLMPWPYMSHRQTRLKLDSTSSPTSPNPVTWRHFLTESRLISHMQHGCVGLLGTYQTIRSAPNTEETITSRENKDSESWVLTAGKRSLDSSLWITLLWSSSSFSWACERKTAILRRVSMKCVWIHRHFSHRSQIGSQCVPCLLLAGEASTLDNRGFLWASMAL